MCQHAFPAVCREPTITDHTTGLVIDASLPTVQRARLERLLATHPGVGLVNASRGLSPEEMDQLCKRAYLRALPGRVATLMRPTLELLDPSVADAVRSTILGAPHVKTVSDIAAAAGVSRRTLYRRLDIAGFRHPKQIIRVSRLLRTLPPIAFGNSPLMATAYSLGYPKYYDFQKLTRQVFGVSPSQLRRGVDNLMLAGAAVNAVLSG